MIKYNSPSFPQKQERRTSKDRRRQAAASFPKDQDRRKDRDRRRKDESVSGDLIQEFIPILKKRLEVLAENSFRITRAKEKQTGKLLELYEILADLQRQYRAKNR